MHKASYIHNHTLTEETFTGCCLDCERSFKIIKKHILNFYEEIKDYSYSDLEKIPSEELYRKYQLLDDITKLKGSDNLSKMILNSEEIKERLPSIRSFYRDFFDVHEKYLANEIYNSQTPWEIISNFDLLPRYKKLIENQLKLIKSGQNSRVIFLGCGPLPTSLIVLSKFFNIKCVGIDTDYQAVKLAKQTIEKLNLKNNIEIYRGNESDIINIPGNIVVVAAMALPKKRIFKNLLAIIESRENLKILYRTYTGLRQLLHIPVSENDIKGFVKTGEVIHSGKVNNTLVLLSREKV